MSIYKDSTQIIYDDKWASRVYNRIQSLLIDRQLSWNRGNMAGYQRADATLKRYKLRYREVYREANENYQSFVASFYETGGDS